MIESKLKQLGYSLPLPIKPVGAYTTWIISGNLLFLSGILPFKEGRIVKTGKVGENITLEEAQKEAIQTVLNALAIVKDCLGSLDKVKRCIKLTGYINSSSDFYEHPKVLNPASELLINIFGQNGKHCRVAVGVCSLPLNSTVEIDFIFEIQND